MSSGKGNKIGLTKVKGVACNAYRSVYFLDLEGEKTVNAHSAFKKIKNSVDGKKLKRGMDYWVSNHNNNSLHHGWDKREHNGEFVNIHVFKGNSHRLYGFKFHPPGDKRSEACILILHFVKNQQDAPVGELRKLLKIMTKDEILAHLKREFS